LPGENNVATIAHGEVFRAAFQFRRPWLFLIRSRVLRKDFCSDPINQPSFHQGARLAGLEFCSDMCKPTIAGDMSEAPDRDARYGSEIGRDPSTVGSVMFGGPKSRYARRECALVSGKKCLRAYL